MFKWPGEPSPSDEAHELADYVELVAWRDGSMSAVALIRFLGRREDPDYSAGVPEEDETDTVVEDAFGEIERRREACAGDYPFVLETTGAPLSNDKEDVPAARRTRCMPSTSTCFWLPGWT